MNFSVLVPYITHGLSKHHELYTGKVKAEQWEEISASALKAAGLGSDWKPNNNHRVGVDQTTNCGVKISNKSGSLGKNLSKVSVSGSRLTKHPTLHEKLEFLSNRHEDFIFCLATNNDDWKNNKKVYYFIVIDSQRLNYHEASWEDTLGVRGRNKGKIVGHKCAGNGFSANITMSMSDQLWTDIGSTLFKEIHELII
jgi:hypothetical protein